MSQAPPPVANTGEDVIHRDIVIDKEEFNPADTTLEAEYEIFSTLQQIEKGGYKRVSLPCLGRIGRLGPNMDVLDCSAIPG